MATNPIASCEDTSLAMRVRHLGKKYSIYAGVDYILHPHPLHGKSVYFARCQSAKKMTFTIHDCGQTEVVTAEPYDEVPDDHVFSLAYTEPPWRIICPAAWWNDAV